MSPANPVSPDVVRALVRQELEERLGVHPSVTPSSQTMSAHVSFSVVAPGPECSEDMDFPVRKPCLIEPHRPCYNSGYCRKLGY
ncbi:MAG TPA: hypothetical protein VGC53_00195 [Vicinamibacteria bacterium]|jgi:hypothetical protein